MSDERIERALKLGPVDEPAYQAGIRARIGASSSAASPDGPPMASTEDGPELASPTRIDVHQRVGARTSQTPRLATLAQVAAVFAIVVVMAAVAVPGLIGGLRTSGTPSAQVTCSIGCVHRVRSGCWCPRARRRRS